MASHEDQAVSKQKQLKCSKCNEVLLINDRSEHTIWNRHLETCTGEGSSMGFFENYTPNTLREEITSPRRKIRRRALKPYETASFAVHSPTSTHSGPINLPSSSTSAASSFRRHPRSNVRPARAQDYPDGRREKPDPNPTSNHSFSHVGAPTATQPAAGLHSIAAPDLSRSKNRAHRGYDEIVQEISTRLDMPAPTQIFSAQPISGLAAIDHNTATPTGSYAALWRSNTTTQASPSFSPLSSSRYDPFTPLKGSLYGDLSQSASTPDYSAPNYPPPNHSPTNYPPPSFSSSQTSWAQHYSMSPYSPQYSPEDGSPPSAVSSHQDTHGASDYRGSS